MKKVTIIFITIISMFLLSSCIAKKDNKNIQSTDATKEDETIIATPDNIIFYNKGKEFTINKQDKKYEKIIEQARNSMKKIDDRFKCILNPQQQKKSGVLLEFDYNENHNFKLKSSKNEDTIVYSRVYFDLDLKKLSENEPVLVDFGDEKGSLGPIVEGENLLKLLID